jgi:transposase
MASRREGLKDLPMVLAYGKLPSMRVLHADKGKRIVLSSPAKPNSAWVPILVTEKGIRLIAYEPPKAPAPAKPQRELRTSTRHRSNQVERRGQLVNEIHKLLEQTNIKLGCVATDIMGVSGRAMLEALLGEQNDAKLLADLAKGCLRNKRAELEKALQGKVQAHHRLVLAQLLTDIDLLGERIAELDREIAQRVAPDQEQIELLDGIPGINQRVAEVIVAEVGTDMSRFPSAKHLALWAGLCSGNNQSGGRRRSGKTREGNRYLRTTLVESAQGAARKKDSYPKALFHRLAGKRGKKRAMVAVAHSTLETAYYVLSRKQPYRDLGGNYFDQRNPAVVLKRLLKRIENLGFQVTVVPLAKAA